MILRKNKGIGEKMSTALREHLAHYWFETQGVLFPKLVEKTGPLTKHHEQLIGSVGFAVV